MPPRSVSSPPARNTFDTGLLREIQAVIDGALRALQANRVEDALLGLERLDADLREQIRWERG